MEYLAQALGVIAWFTFCFAVMTFVGKREAQAENEPVNERIRAETIAKSIGAWTIWLFLGVTFLAALASGIWVFVGLATGDDYVTTMQMGILLAVSLPAFFYLERVSKALHLK